MAYDVKELYVTDVETEAYELAGEVTIAGIPVSVNPKQTNAGKPYYVVMLRNDSDGDKARDVRRKVIGS